MIPQAGLVDIVQGRMGGGKSFHGVQEALRIAVEEGRPVFTNLPLRFRVVRRWLTVKHDRQFGGLLFPLTEEHFRRFCTRQAVKAKFRDEMKMALAVEGKPFHEVAFAKAWHAKHGPDVVEGPAANWVHPASTLILDEFHRWFPGGGRADEVLRGYLTMLRHHLHNLICMTQDYTQVDVSVRRLARRVTFVRKRDDDKIIWSVRFRHVGLSCLSVVTFPSEVVTELGVQDFERLPVDQAMDNRTVFHTLPCKAWVFRLYDSFTHVGSRRRLMGALSDVRERLGVNEAVKRLEGQRMEAAKRRKWGLFRFVRRALFRLAFLAVVAVSAWVARGLKDPPPAVAAVAESGAVPAMDLGGRRLMGTGRGVAIFGNSIVPKGGRVGEGVLLAVGRGGVVMRDDDGLWVVEVGKEPSYLGGDREVAERLRARAAPAGVAVPAPGRRASTE